MALTKVITGVTDLNQAQSTNGLKFPTGSVFAGTPEEGMIRNDQSQSSETSSSAMQFYNGTAWKNFVNKVPCTTDNAAYPVTNTAYYKLNNNANDSSGNGYNGTASNVTYAAGKFDDAAVFNGTSSYIDTNATFTPDLMSFSVWVKPTNSSSTRYVSSNRGGNSTNYKGVDLGITPSGNIYSRFDNGGSRGSSNSDTVPVPLNIWTHLAFTIDMSNSIQKVYKNGVFVYQETTSGSVATGNDFYIGRYYFSSSDYWQGSIDQIRIFSSALNAAQVTQLYNEIQC